MNKLRTRLLLSYIGIVLITLLFTAALLVLLLRNRPVSSTPILIRLSGISRIVQEQSTTPQLLNLSPSRLESFMDRLASRIPARVIMGTTEDGILYDSLDSLVGSPARFLQDHHPLRQQPNLYQGQFVENGETWLFVGKTLQTRRGPVELLLAEVQPSSSWAEVMRVFGTDMLLPLLQAGGIALLLAVLLAWLSSRWVSLSLDGLSHGAQTITEGDYGARVSLNGPDEVRAVAGAFNQMAAQVQATQATQQDFLANISHDLKTPLTSIQGFSQAIIDGTSQDPAHHAQIIHDEAHRLNRLVGQLNDLSRVMAGRFTMQHAQVNLGPLTERLVEGLALKAQLKGVTLKPAIQPVPEIAGDGDRLAQVITNLLDNAIKFTPSGGLVRVAVYPHEGGIALAVSDTGSGIPADDLPRIFERFYSVDKARGPARGSGLGLTIAAEIVKAHGGKISAASAGINQGTAFTCWFPALGMSTVTHKR